MSDVPSEIHREILLRLPATSLFCFRTVCKSWRRIIDDPSFVRSHTTNNQRSSPNLLIRTSTGTFFSFSLDSLNYINGEQTIHVTHVKNLSRRGVARIGSLPVASCNGLVLISHFEKNKIWAIWNPLAGDFREIPEPNVFKLHILCSGIGYDSNSDDYKVVRVYRSYIQDETVYPTLVYSLKSNSWENIENFPGDFFLSCNQMGVFFNGSLHWKSSRGMIVALDMATNEYRQLPLPPTNSVLDVRLDSFDGCLVLSDDYAMWRSWVMRDYESEDPIWVDLFSSKERSVIGGSSGCLWPLAYSNSEKQFIVQHDNRIMRWDIEKVSVKRVTIDGLSCSVTSQVIPGSLFRLSEAGVKRKRSKRYKFTATTIDSGRLSDSDYYSSENDDDYY